MARIFGFDAVVSFSRFVKGKGIDGGQLASRSDTFASISKHLRDVMTSCGIKPTKTVTVG